MIRLLSTTLGVLLIAGIASAQQIYHVVDSVFIHTDAAWNVDRPMYRAFGFSTGYTDTIDYRLQSQNREREVPAFPPSTFYALFESQNPAGPLIDRDVRGVPDSVINGTLSRFSRRYVIEIQRALGQQVTLVMTRAFPLGIDSINFRDIIGAGGTVFNQTLTAGSDSVIIPHAALTRIAMIVYYDESDLPSAINESWSIAKNTSLPLTPNPATDAVVVEAILSAGSRIIVSDIRGATVSQQRLSESADRTWLSLSPLTDGVYFVRALDDQGSLVASNRLVVRR
ncbi:MAG: T9SS type A sorting domain-containing protein [bacterium]|nr:T9SS type A sorting domain-containing protein [Candidatus Kapabacteria bacterium]